MNRGDMINRCKPLLVELEERSHAISDGDGLLYCVSTVCQRVMADHVRNISEGHVSSVGLGSSFPGSL